MLEHFWAALLLEEQKPGMVFVQCESYARRFGHPVLSRHKYIPIQNSASRKAHALPERKISNYEKYLSYL